MTVKKNKMDPVTILASIFHDSSLVIKIFISG